MSPHSRQPLITNRCIKLHERLKREGVKTHKERVEELNRYLSAQSEHHDMFVISLPASASRLTSTIGLKSVLVKIFSAFYPGTWPIYWSVALQRLGLTTFTISLIAQALDLSYTMPRIDTADYSLFQNCVKSPADACQREMQLGDRGWLRHRRFTDASERRDSTMTVKML